MITDYKGALFLDSDTNDDRADNRASRFHTFMHSSFIFTDDDHEVGLLEIQMPHTWKNLVNDQFIGCFTPGEIRNIRLVESGCYYDAGELVKTLNSLCAEPKLSYDHSRVSVKMGAERTLFAATQELAEILGLDYWFTPMETVADSSNMASFKLHGLWRMSDFRASRPINLQASIERVFISSSIVKHRAHAQHELLRAFPVSTSLEFGEIDVHRFNRPLFVPIAHQSFDRIEICILDRKGRELEFTAGNVIVVLEIRKRKDG